MADSPEDTLPETEVEPHARVRDSSTILPEDSDSVHAPTLPSPPSTPSIPENKKRSFESLLEWALNSENVEEVENLIDTAGSRLRAFTMIAAQANMSRIAALHKAATAVQDALVNRIDEMSINQLIALRGYLEKDINTSINKMLPHTQEGGRSAQLNILNLFSSPQQSNGLPPAPSSTLPQESRERVRRFLQALNSESTPSSPPLRVILGQGEEKK